MLTDFFQSFESGATIKEPERFFFEDNGREIVARAEEDIISIRCNYIVGVAEPSCQSLDRRGKLVQSWTGGEPLDIG
jgi:hypothetical protein